MTITEIRQPKVTIFSVCVIAGLLLTCPHTSAALSTKQTTRLLSKGLGDIRRSRGKCAVDVQMRSSRDSACDPDRDKLPNYLEKRFRTRPVRADTDGDGLTDYQELRFYGTDPRKADTDNDGISDGEEIHRYGTNPRIPERKGDGEPRVDNPPRKPTVAPDMTPALTPTSTPAPTTTPSVCTTPNFDGALNTSSFGIPSGMLGNVAVGDSLYDQRCASCHAYAGNFAARHGYHFTYPALAARLPESPMFITDMTPQQVADLVASLNQDMPGGGGDCRATPTPVGTPLPTSTPTNTPTPYVPPTPCAGGNFDAQGNTTAFGIPTPLVGNISSGQTQYNSTCGAGGCHGVTVRGIGYQFSVLKSAVTNPPMSLSIGDQALANLIAFLNQSNPGGCTTGTPTPTPTPNPVTYGMQIFTSSCSTSGCHTLNSSGRPRNMDLHPSRNQIHEALRTGPDRMPQFLYFTLGSSAPPYSAQEEALYQYLLSIR